eukprot:Rhum_TRINITY_DN12889_c0_g2::Rhum_TRINITY_DN12889_c0_g2_i1::g.55090::m.55090/K00604/MTFMT, fmt; methionyl-tRNA formyltransferase
MFRVTRLLRQYNVLFLGSNNISEVCLGGLIDDLQADQRMCKHLRVVAPPATHGRHAGVVTQAKARGVAWEEVGCPRSLKGWKVPEVPGGWDVCVVASFRYFIPGRVIASFRHGVINVHPSLLPRYRGSSPLQAAIRRNDAEGGVCIIKIQARELMDTGDVLARQRIHLTPRTSFDAYLHAASAAAVALLRRVLCDLPAHWAAAETQPLKQLRTTDDPHFARLILRDDCRVDFHAVSAHAASAAAAAGQLQQPPPVAMGWAPGGRPSPSPAGEDIFHFWRALTASGGVWAWFDKQEALRRSGGGGGGASAKKKKSGGCGGGGGGAAEQRSDGALRCAFVTMAHPADAPVEHRELLRSLAAEAAPGAVVFPSKRCTVFYVRTTDAESWASVVQLHISCEKPKSATEFMTGYRFKARQVYNGVFL